jgi:hypothetical protein
MLKGLTFLSMQLNGTKIYLQIKKQNSNKILFCINKYILGVRKYKIQYFYFCKYFSEENNNYTTYYLYVLFMHQSI